MYVRDVRDVRDVRRKKGRNGRDAQFPTHARLPVGATWPMMWLMRFMF